jgi:hypothetical protein
MFAKLVPGDQRKPLLFPLANKCSTRNSFWSSFPSSGGNGKCSPWLQLSLKSVTPFRRLVLSTRLIATPLPSLLLLSRTLCSWRTSSSRICATPSVVPGGPSQVPTPLSQAPQRLFPAPVSPFLQRLKSVWSCSSQVYFLSRSGPVCFRSRPLHSGD